ncbi:hypothetical protein V6N11_063330 [Hibiscus sabdariffa]|uniref:Uncharacterized protein n=1 Tax=Hibiscus sabdariffa TaxID=183260 RepID=A0ABR2N7D8_9ROSI
MRKEYRGNGDALNDEGFVDPNQSSLQPPSIHSSLLVVHGAVSGLHMAAKEVGLGVTKVFDKLSMRIDNDLKNSNETKVFDPLLNEIQTISIVKIVTADDGGAHDIKPDIVCELGNLCNNKRSMSDEMLARANGALSTVGDLVHLGEWVIEYNPFRVLIPSFDPGGSEAIPTVIENEYGNMEDSYN